MVEETKHGINMKSAGIRAGSFLKNATVFAALIFAASTGAASSADVYAQFKSENDAAMGKMMTRMAIKPSGNVDRDFTEMMIAHHQGAIDMSEAELRHGANEQLRRIAQEIIIDQQQEIAAMRLAVGDPPPPSKPAPTQPQSTPSSNPSTSMKPEQN
jgi:hypothetical protein